MDTHFPGAPRPAQSPTSSRRLLAAILLSTLVAAGLALGTTASASAVTATRVTTTQVQSYPAMAPSAYEKRVQHWINVRRSNHNLRALRLASCPDGSAERWSSYLARNDLFYHQSMQVVLNRCNASYAGETLGRGAIAPRRLVRMWMRSDGHRQVLLSPKSRRIGIGAKPDAYGRWVVAANFIRF